MVMNNNESNKPASTFSSIGTGANNPNSNTSADALKKEANKPATGSTASNMNQYGMAPNLSEQKSTFGGFTTSTFPGTAAANTASAGTSTFGGFKSSNFNSPFGASTPTGKPNESPAAFGTNLPNLGKQQASQPSAPSGTPYSAFKPAEPIKEEPFLKKEEYSTSKKEESYKPSTTITPSAKNGPKTFESKAEFKPMNFNNISAATKPSMAVPSTIEKPPTEISKPSMPILGAGAKSSESIGKPAVLAGNNNKGLKPGPIAEEKKAKGEPSTSRKPKSPEILHEKEPAEPKETAPPVKKEKRAPKPKAPRPTEATRHSTRAKKPVSQVQIAAPTATIQSKEVEIPKVTAEIKLN